MATEASPRVPPRTQGPPGEALASRQSQRRSAALTLVAVLAALVALATAASLPFAPVRHDRPVVSWPQDQAAPVSTSLMLVAHRPAALEVSTTCATARAAAERGDGLLFSTMRPQSAQSATDGLLWWVTDGQLRLDVAGTVVDSRPLPTGDCSLQVVTTPDGAGVALLVDGEPVGAATTELPEVDSLVTSLTSLDAGAGEELAVTVAVNDEFASSPTAVKRALTALLLLSGLVVLVCLALADRARARDDRAGTAPWRRRWRPRPADLAVAALVVGWAFVAPMTDDDGYYAAMARNVLASGYVGQYYQLYDQSFVPLTWPWYALSWWTTVADSPFGLRVPALVLGLLTWLGVRRCADVLLGHHPRWGSGGVVRGRVTALLALAFATAWTPYVMGVRPEAVSAAASVAVLTGVLAALRTGRRLPLALAVVAAALSCAAHPTGAVAVAPLLAAAPALWRRLRADRWPATLARVLTVVAPGAMATAAGFADGTLYDFRRGREVFEAIERPLQWTQEIRRYEFLLNQDIPMGAYAKRTVVLLALLGVALSLLLAVAARARRLPDDLGAWALAVTGTSTLLAFVALWVTPSKWTHHFGSLAGLAPLLLTAVVLLGPGLARRALPGRGGGAVGVGVVAAVVAVASVSMAGPNLWPYGYDLGMPHPRNSPYLSVVQFRSPVWWALGAALVAGALALWQRSPRRRAAAGAWPSLALLSAAVTAVVVMAVSTTHLVGSFALATATTLDAYSPSAALATDPGGEDCGAAGAISVADDTRATPLTPAAGVGEALGASTPVSSPAGTFTRGAGWWQGDPPPAEGGRVWGSLAGGDLPTGELVTPWYDLGDSLTAGDAPARGGRGGGTAVTVLAAGNLLVGDGNSLVAEYGVSEDDGVRVTTVEPLGDGVMTTEWRWLRLGDPSAAAGPDAVVGTPDDLAPVPDGPAYDPALAREADVVRVRAVDGAPAQHGWLAVGEPSAAPVVSMADYVPADATVAKAWQRAYLFPCGEQVLTARGISTRPEYAVLFGDRTLEGLGDSVWQPGRGGLYAQVPEAATLTQVSSWFTATPDVGWGQLARVDWPYAAAAYDVRLVPQVSSGAHGPTPPPLG